MKKRALILTAVLTAAALTGGSGYLPVTDGIRSRMIQNVYADAEDSKESADTETSDSVLDQATIMYQQYNYDEAIKLLKKQDDFTKNKDYMDLAAKCQIAKKSLVEYPLEKITHVFFHTLIEDTSRAFDGDSKSGNYNQVMTTVSEFNKIIQIMYDKGYVLVSPHDMATVNKDGTMSRGKIMVPEGKIPFVLSQDDVSYYHYMDGDGCASKLVLDENGEVKNEYVDADGNVLVGDYDLVPLLDSFIKEHPDFSYHGRKGILAMTGYNGVLGYRTDSAYKTGENLQNDQKKFLEDNPDFDYDQDVADATEVADAMKAEGREFKGIIFFGLMLTADGPKVLEYNARFGDPETQVVLPRMKNDIVDVFEACVDGTLDQIDLQFEDNAAVCVVLASDGYPEHYEKGKKITGLENFKDKDGYYVFHAGSKFDAEGNILTNGGRVLGVTATGKDLKEARANAYKATEWVNFENKYMRHDIGHAIDEA